MSDSSNRIEFLEMENYEQENRIQYLENTLAQLCEGFAKLTEHVLMLGDSHCQCVQDALDYAKHRFSEYDSSDSDSNSYSNSSSDSDSDGSPF